MRVQYTKAENEVIEIRRKENKNFDGILIPVEGQGKEMTLGLEITDVHKFNVFLSNWLYDQGAENPEITNEIGAKVTHIDYRAPIKTEYLLFLQNYINGMLYGPTPLDSAAPQEDQQVILENESTSETPVTENIEKDIEEQKDDNATYVFNNNASTPE
jgi:hypothetical protein